MKPIFKISILTLAALSIVMGSIVLFYIVQSQVRQSRISKMLKESEVLFKKGDFDGLLEVAQDTINLAKKEFRQPDIRLVNAYRYAGIAQGERNEFQKALESFNLGEHTLRDIKNPSIKSAVKFYNFFGGLYMSYAFFKESKVKYDEAFKIAKGQKNMETAITLFGLAYFAYMEQEFLKSEEIHNQIKAMIPFIQPRKREIVMANLLFSRGGQKIASNQDFVTGLKMQKEALELLGKKAPELGIYQLELYRDIYKINSLSAALLNNEKGELEKTFAAPNKGEAHYRSEMQMEATMDAFKAGYLYKQKRINEAIDAYDKTIPRLLALSKDNPQAQLIALLPYISAYEQSNEVERLRPYLKKVERAMTSVKGLAPKQTCFAYYYFGVLESELGNPEKAENAYRNALSACAGNWAESPVYMASTNAGLGNMAYDKGDYEAAMPYYLKSLDYARKAYRDSPAELRWFLNKIAYAYYQWKKFDEAEAYYEELMELDKKNFGEASAQYATDLIDRGNVYIQTNRYDEARRFYKDALVIQRALKNSDWPEIARAHYNLALACDREDKIASAIKNYKKAQEIREKEYGKENEWAKKTTENIVRLTQQIDSVKKSEPYQKSFALIKSNTEIARYLGTPLSEASVLLGRVDIDGVSGTAGFVYLVKGPKNFAKISVRAELKAEQWEYDFIIADLGKEKTRVDLTPSPNAEEIKTLSLSELYKKSEVFPVIKNQEILEAVKKNDFAKAELLADKDLANAENENQYGQQDPDTAYFLVQTAEIYRFGKKANQAEEFYAKAIRNIDDHPTKPRPVLQAVYMNGLGRLYDEEGRSSEAEAMFILAILNLEKVKLTEDPQNKILKESLINLADFYSAAVIKRRNLEALDVETSKIVFRFSQLCRKFGLFKAGSAINQRANQVVKNIHATSVTGFMVQQNLAN